MTIPISVKRDRVGDRTVALRAGIGREIVPLIGATVVVFVAPQIGLSLRLVAEIGVLRGAPPEEFGLIQDVATDAMGRVYVLDSRTYDLRVFDRRGKFLYTAGRNGRGPGEFYVPVAVAADSAGTVYVLDEGNWRVSAFQATNSALKYASSFPIDFSGSDLCLLGGRLYVLGLRDGTQVQVYSSLGERLLSFGAPYRPEHPVLNRSLSRGRIDCVGDSGIIVVSLDLLPEVRAYTSDGALLWTTVLGDFRQVTIDENTDGSITYTAGSDRAYDVLASLLYVHPRIVLAQVGKLTSRASAADNFQTIDTRFISLMDGKELQADQSLPLFRAISPIQIYAVRNHPYPTLSMYHYTLR
ncbi:MAG TPA: 6-bladed beta-propeller [Gemmatimonadales bacterium]|nr:6-bladed beta-propeller [Gemmatimonadales bacterium]